MTEQNPAQITGVTPYINIEGASEASAFYQRAFGAKELMRLPADDGKRLMHCHLVINGGPLLMSDFFPEHGHPHHPSQNFTLHLQVDDVDKWFDRAVSAGAKALLPPQMMFWGDRYGQITDPFGVRWSIASTPKA
jgi:uncharacterized glyoxalase superfamily protein PhnB